MSEGGEARNHEADREAVAKALAFEDAGNPEMWDWQGADAALKALDALRRSPRDPCGCVCHVGIDGDYTADMCDCPTCPARHPLRGEVQETQTRYGRVRAAIGEPFGQGVDVEATKTGRSPQGEDHEAGKYVCPNGHRILAEKTVLCDECPGLTVYVPLSRLIAEREHRPQGEDHEAENHAILFLRASGWNDAADDLEAYLKGEMT